MWGSRGTYRYPNWITLVIISGLYNQCLRIGKAKFLNDLKSGVPIYNYGTIQYGGN